MEAVGLFEAKTHLSEYVARAEAGEEVIIMRHNKPVAKIVPIEPQRDSKPRFDPEQRRKAIEQVEKLRAQFKAAGVSISGAEFAQWRREEYDERADRALGAPGTPGAQQPDGGSA
jgi:prevent-host-death family protein